MRGSTDNYFSATVAIFLYTSLFILFMPLALLLKKSCQVLHYVFTKAKRNDPWKVHCSLLDTYHIA